MKVLLGSIEGRGLDKGDAGNGGKETAVTRNGQLEQECTGGEETGRKEVLELEAWDNIASLQESSFLSTL